jgi:hypothetical protein
MFIPQGMYLVTDKLEFSHRKLLENIFTIKKENAS